MLHVEFKLDYSFKGVKNPMIIIKLLYGSSKSFVGTLGYKYEYL